MNIFAEMVHCIVLEQIGNCCSGKTLEVQFLLMVFNECVDISMHICLLSILPAKYTPQTVLQCRFLPSFVLVDAFDWALKE